VTDGSTARVEHKGGEDKNPGYGDRNRDGEKTKTDGGGEGEGKRIDRRKGTWSESGKASSTRREQAGARPYDKRARSSIEPEPSKREGKAEELPGAEPWAIARANWEHKESRSRPRRANEAVRTPPGGPAGREASRTPGAVGEREATRALKSPRKDRCRGGRASRARERSQKSRTHPRVGRHGDAY